MLHLDAPPADAPAMTISVATPENAATPRRSRSRMEDRPPLTDDYVRAIIANGDHLPNLVRDGGPGATTGFAFRRSKRDYVVRYTYRASTERLFRIGPWPRWNTEKARKRANEVLIEVDKGAMPLPRSTPAAGHHSSAS
jgi:hypothetical protein